MILLFFFSSRRRHTRLTCDWSSDMCSSDLVAHLAGHAASEPAVEARDVFRGKRGSNACQLKPALVSDALYGSGVHRSEERRVGKECRSRWRRYHESNKTYEYATVQCELCYS